MQSKYKLIIAVSLIILIATPVLASRRIIEDFPIFIDLAVTNNPSLIINSTSGGLEIGDGFLNGGISLQADGDILMDGSLFLTGNISSVTVTNLDINGSFIPIFDNTFFLGNTTNRWNALAIGTGASSFDGEVTFNDILKFNTTISPPSHAEGNVFWSDADNTLSIQTDVTDVTLQVGQEQFIKARNNIGSTINNGQAVYVTGATGNRPTVALANADNASTSNTMGVATEDILNNADGYITTFGLVRDLDTSAFSAGDILYLNTSDGDLTNLAPTPPNFIVQMGIVLTSNPSTGVIFISPHIDHTDGVVLNNLDIINNLTVDIDTLFVDSINNRVGIGTLLPQNELDVVGTINTTTAFYTGDGAAGMPSYTFGNDINTGFYSPAANDIGVSIDGDAKWIFGNAGTDFFDAAITNGPAMVNEAASDSNPTFMPRGTGDSNTGVGSGGSDQLNLITNGLTALTVDSSQNVGINTTTPTQPLTVVGDVNYTGNLTGNFIYAEMYNNISQTVQIGTSNEWFNISMNFTDFSNGFTRPDNDTLRAQLDGIYYMRHDESFSNGANREFHVTLSVNNVPTDKCHAERRLSAGGDKGNSGAGCIVQIITGDNITMQINNIDSTDNAIMSKVNMFIQRVGIV